MTYNKDIQIIADDKIPFLRGILEPYAEVKYFPGAKINQHILKNADTLITRTRTKVTKDLLENKKLNSLPLLPSVLIILTLTGWLRTISGGLTLPDVILPP